MAFYLIATQIGNVYEVSLPEGLRALLDSLSVALTFGIKIAFDVAPLECAGLEGYTSRLVFFMVWPYAVVLFLLVASFAFSALRCKGCSLADSVASVAPYALELLFLSYPIITREAFEAWPCHEFANGERWLRADVGIPCDTTEHQNAKSVAIIAIAIYPVLQLVVFTLLLALARGAIVSGRPTRLSTAIAFLHREYKPETMWWELMEMLRRFILVGVLVVVRQGSIEQLAYGTVVAIMFLSIQTAASPYRKPSDDLFANGCSLLLSVFFVVALVFKYMDLTERAEQQLSMSPEQIHDYVMEGRSVIFSSILT